MMVCLMERSLIEIGLIELSQPWIIKRPLTETSLIEASVTEVDDDKMMVGVWLWERRRRLWTDWEENAEGMQHLKESTHTHTHIHAVCGERLSTLFAVGVCANKTNLFHGKICTHQGEWRGFTLLRWPPAWNPNQFCWCHTTLVSTCRKQSMAHRHVGVGLSVTFPLKEIQVKSYSVTPQN